MKFDLFVRWWMVGLLLILTGCTGLPMGNPHITFPSEGVVIWEQGRARIPTELANQIVASFRKLQHQAGTNSRFQIDGTPLPNAYAGLSNGRAIVTLNAGLIDMVGMDADAMAFVLAHELAHVSLGHVSPQAVDRAQSQKVRSGFLGTVAASLIPFGGLLVDAGSGLIEAGYSRDQEREADGLGLQLMIGAGYEPEGAIRFQRKMLSVGAVSGLPFLSSHPGGEERIERLRELMEVR